MDKIDFKHLELLLLKLCHELGDKKFCLIPFYIHDGVHIATYKDNGELDQMAIAANIEEAIIKLKNSTNG